MKTAVERATADDVRRVALAMRARDYAEFSAISFCDDREKLADELATRYGGREDVLCGFGDGRPICIGGTIEAWPNVITLLFFATDDFPAIGRNITRFIRRELFPRYFAAGVRRIQAVSLGGYSDVHAWLKTLGLKQETGPMLGYGKHGEAFVQFSKVLNAKTDR